MFAWHAHDGGFSAYREMLPPPPATLPSPLFLLSFPSPLPIAHLEPRQVDAHARAHGITVCTIKSHTGFPFPPLPLPLPRVCVHIYFNCRYLILSVATRVQAEIRVQ